MKEAVRIISVVGARPQFIKAATISRAIAANGSARSKSVFGDGDPADRVCEIL